MFDRDGNGTISASELTHAFRIQGQDIPDAEIRNTLGKSMTIVTIELILISY